MCVCVCASLAAEQYWLPWNILGKLLSSLNTIFLTVFLLILISNLNVFWWLSALHTPMINSVSFPRCRLSPSLFLLTFFYRSLAFSHLKKKKNLPKQFPDPTGKVVEDTHRFTLFGLSFIIAGKQQEVSSKYRRKKFSHWIKELCVWLCKEGDMEL